MKKISHDDKVAKLSLEATLLYTWCIPNLDIEGRIYGDIWTLKSIVPHIDEITPENIPEIIEEWVESDLVNYYGDSKKYIQFKGFKNNQTLRDDREAPSVIPDPDKLQTNSGATQGQVKLSKDKISKEKVEIPPPYEHLRAYCKERGNKIDPEKFWDFYESNGWLVGKNSMKDWKAAVRTWEKRGDGPVNQNQSTPKNTRGSEEYPHFPEQSKEDRKKVSELISETAKKM